MPRFQADVASWWMLRFQVDARLSPGNDLNSWMA